MVIVCVCVSGGGRGKWKKVWGINDEEKNKQPKPIKISRRILYKDGFLILFSFRFKRIIQHAVIPWVLLKAKGT